MNDDYRWLTYREKDVIENLGSFSLSKSTRLELLFNYKKSLKYRVNWEEVIRLEVETYLEEQIRLESIQCGVAYIGGKQ